MFKKTLAVSVIAIVAAIVFTPTLSAAPTSCATTTFDAYLLSGFTCQTGGIEFSNFGFSSTGIPNGVAIPANGVNITPITTDGNVGFMWAMGMGGATQPNGSSMFQDILLYYTATALPGTLITDLHLFFNGSYTGTGATSVTETYCKNGPLIGCAPGDIGQISTTNPPANFNDATFFPGVGSISVSKDIQGLTGIGGTYNISQVANTVSYESVPEPATLAMVGFVLFVVGTFRRRQQA